MVIVCALAAACSQQPARKSVVRETPNKVPSDFSGSWEMDHSRSDDVNQELKELFRKMSRSAQNQAPQRDSRSRSIDIGVSSGAVASTVALARLAESITRSQVLEIEQGENAIEVTRKDDFSLTCGFQENISQLVETAFGAEWCGWDEDRMIFHVSLPDGLTISHRMTIAPDRQKIHIATTVASTAAPAPFTLSRFYNRFEPLPSEFDCEYTLSKKKACSPRRSGL